MSMELASMDLAPVGSGPAPPPTPINTPLTLVRNLSIGRAQTRVYPFFTGNVGSSNANYGYANMPAIRITKVELRNIYQTYLPDNANLGFRIFKRNAAGQVSNALVHNFANDDPRVHESTNVINVAAGESLALYIDTSSIQFNPNQGNFIAIFTYEFV